MAIAEKGATDSFDRDFILMISTPVKAPGGGFLNVWNQGGKFRGALSILQSTEAMIAQAQTGVELGVLAVNKINKLPMGTHFMDPLNEKYYRITNAGQGSSSALTLDQIQYSVVWVPALPI